MCGRYCFTPAAAQSLNFHAGEVYPGQSAPVIIPGVKEGVPRLMKWGFPRIGGGGLVINSRSEKADVTNMFRRAVRERRCLVPMSGFFEWKRTASGSKTKEKYFFQSENVSASGGLMMAAGLYGRFSPRASEPFDGFVIMTREADEQMQPYHHRMPVLLEGEACLHWLNAPPSMPYDALRLLFRPPALVVRRADEEELP